MILLTLILVLSAVPLFWASASEAVVKDTKNLGLALLEKAKFGKIKNAELNIQEEDSLTALVFLRR